MTAGSNWRLGFIIINLLVTPINSQRHIPRRARKSIRPGGEHVVLLLLLLLLLLIRHLHRLTHGRAAAQIHRRPELSPRIETGVLDV